MNREQRLGYERRILAAEVEWVSLAKFAMHFCELMERNTRTLDAALCLANARAEREKYDRLVVEPWAPMLLALQEKITQNDLFPTESDNQKRLLSEKQPKSVVEYWPEDPTQHGDDVAYEMREYYEANRPLRWWEKRNPPGTWGCIADELMLGLRNIVLNAERKP